MQTVQQLKSQMAILAKQIEYALKINDDVINDDIANLMIEYNTIGLTLQFAKEA